MNSSLNIPWFKGKVDGYSDSSVTVSGCKNDDSSIISLSASFLTKGIVDLKLTKAGETSLLPDVPLSHSDDIRKRPWRCRRSFSSADLEYFCPGCPRRGLICNGSCRNNRNRCGGNIKIYYWWCTGNCTPA